MSARRQRQMCIRDRNRTKHANLRGSPLFQATYNIKAENKQIIQLVSFRRSRAGGKIKILTQDKLNDLFESLACLGCLFVCLFL